MGSPGTSWDARDPPSQRNQCWAQDGPYSSPACMPGADRPFMATSPSRYEDQWAMDEAPWHENWPGKLEVDEGSEEKDDALSYLSLGEIEQVWGQEYVDFGAIYCRHVKGSPHQPSHHHHNSPARNQGHVI